MSGSDPGQEASQPLDVDFPAEALKAKKLKEIRLELAYIPSPYHPGNGQAQRDHREIVMGVPIDIHIRAGRSHVLARVATSGIYLLRGLPSRPSAGRACPGPERGDHAPRGALARPAQYAAGTWTPKLDEPVADATHRPDGSPPSLAIGSSRAVTIRLCIDTTILAAAGAVPRLSERRLPMTEHITHMGPMLILASLLAAWCREASRAPAAMATCSTWRSASSAAFSPGALVWIFFSGVGMPLMFGSGAPGATLAIAAQRGLWRSVRLGT